jgi:hypothetical protein
VQPASAIVRRVLIAPQSGSWGWLKLFRNKYHYSEIGKFGDGIAFLVIVREGTPSTTSKVASGTVVDGGPAPAMTLGTPVSPDLSTCV